LQAAAGNGQVTLSWNPVGLATGYNVKRSTASGSGYVAVGSGVTGTNYTDLSVVNNTTYYYVVTAVSGGLESANSQEVSATPLWPALSGLIANFGFETPVTSTYKYNPTGGSWTFSAQSGANGSGLCANASGFTIGNPNAPQGSQVAFIQGTGSITQTLLGLIAGAIYQVTFSAAQRNNIYGQQAGQTWKLTVDGTAIGTYAPPEAAQSYVDYTGSFAATSAGSHALAFVGTDANGGDNTVLLDNVRLAFAPALTSPRLACQVAGGQIQFVWPADHAGWELQVQTNSLTQGLGTNWTTLSGSTLGNQFSFPVSLAGGSVFFRLAYP
jgi:hypothetical protein